VREGLALAVRSVDSEVQTMRERGEGLRSESEGRVIEEREGAWTRWEMVVMNTEAAGCLSAVSAESTRDGVRGMADRVGERS
jgi:hypothetical protein